MELVDILTKEEARALARAKERFNRFKEDLETEVPKMDKADFARAVSKKSFDPVLPKM